MNEQIIKILEKNKSNIKSSNESMLLNEFEKIKKLIECSAKNNKIELDVFLGGSLAKGTILKNNEELDIFVRFEKQYKNDELANLLEKILKQNKLKFIRIHGSRDYFKIKTKNYEIELIPIYKINSPNEAVNITDISPLHVKWIKSNIKNYADDIKLAKQFCKANNIYGAESYINGFSGYVLEILTIHYKGFFNLIKNVEKWSTKTIIDIEKYYKNENYLLKEINSSKQFSPLILIDPVQKERNASAAVSEDSYNKFIFSCAQFILNPNEDFFKIKKIDEKSIKKQAKLLDYKLCNLKIERKSENNDIVGTKIRKTKDFLEQQLTKKGFEIGRMYFNLENIWILYTPKKLPKYTLKQGPLILSANSHINNFIGKHKEFFVKGKSLYAFVENKQRDINSCINEILKNYELKNIRIKSIKNKIKKKLT